MEETSKLFNAQGQHRTAVLVSSGKGGAGGNGTDAPEREKRKEMQIDVVNQWRHTVGGYFRRFKPDFGGVKGCNISGDGGVEAVLTYAFLRADLDFITNTRPWFLPDPGEGAPQHVEAPEPTSPSKAGSTATVVLLSTS